LSLIPDGGLVDRHALAARQVDRDAALDAGDQLVPEPRVGERATDHDLVIPAAGAVRVEVGATDAEAEEVPAGRAPRVDGPGRRNVIGRDRVAERGQGP